MKEYKFEKVLITKDELMALTGCGRRRAEKFASMAGARVQIGSNVRYSLDKLREYALEKHYR